MGFASSYTFGKLKEVGARAGILAVSVFSFFVSGVAYAQQDSGDSSTNQPSSTVSLPAVTNADTGQSLVYPLSPLRAGRLSLLSFESFYLSDNNYNLSPSSPLSVQAATFRAHLVYSVRRKHGELTLQYRPYLVTSDGHVQGDYGSHNLGFHSNIRLAPRWGLNLTESFRLSQDRGRVAEFGLIPNYLTGDVTKNPYLATGLKYLENDVGANLQHSLSVRNSVGFDFRYQYIRDLNDVQNTGATIDPSVAILQTLQSFSTGVGWSHSFSPSQGLEIRYGYDHRLYSTGGVTDLHNLLTTYNRRIGRSLFMRLSGGPAVMIRETPVGAPAGLPATKSYEGEFSLTKSFRNTSVSLSAARNVDFTGVISNAFNDRYDLSLTRRINRRWGMLAGTGYVRQGFSSGPRVNGQQIWGRTDYRLFSNWAAFTSFTSLHETGSVYLGRRNLVMVGVRWAWHARSGGESRFGY